MHPLNLDKTPPGEYRICMVDKNGETPPSRRASGPKVTVSNRQKTLDVSESRLRRLVEFVSASERRDIESVDVAIVDADEIESVNRRYLNHPGPTDVLSFDLSDEGARAISAQIIVCSEVATTEAPHHGLSAEDELTLYVIHGLLHLVGYDDAEKEQAERMMTRQEQILAEFNRTRKLTDKI
ncbi:MAG: rRNA maturation RNase YbeY [Planctomycetota bacterium]|nr:rRNA maturation RNase YbeY [Planctomycetota bacterium]